MRLPAFLEYEYRILCRAYKQTGETAKSHLKNILWSFSIITVLSLLAILIPAINKLFGEAGIMQELILLISGVIAVFAFLLGVLTKNIILAPSAMEKELQVLVLEQIAKANERASVAEKVVADIRNALPNIECDIEVRPEPLHADIPGHGSIMVSRPVFARLLIRNRCTSVLNRVDAPNIGAHIEFLGDNGALFPVMTGRWANTKHQAEGAMPSEVAQKTIHPNGVPEPLLIALKHVSDDLAYGLNVDNEKNDGWRDPNKVIPIGTYRVKVYIEGINVDRTLWFVLINKGKATDLEFKSLLNPLVLDKEDSQKQ